MEVAPLTYYIELESYCVTKSLERGNVTLINVQEETIFSLQFGMPPFCPLFQT